MEWSPYRYHAAGRVCRWLMRAVGQMQRFLRWYWGMILGGAFVLGMILLAQGFFFRAFDVDGVDVVIEVRYDNGLFVRDGATYNVTAALVFP